MAKHADFGALAVLFDKLIADATRFAAFARDHLNIGNRQWAWELDFLPSRAALTGAQVSHGHIQTFHDHAFVFWENLNNLTLFSFVFARANADGVAGFDFHKMGYNTSGARETIF